MTADTQQTVRRRRFRMAVVAALVPVVAVALTGCLGPGFRYDRYSEPTKVNRPTAPGPAAAAAPRAGDCWDLDESGAVVNGLWWFGWAVDCDQPHLTATTAVLDIDEVSPEFEYPPDPYAAEYPDSFYRQDALADFEYACLEAAGPGVGLDQGTRVVALWVVPSPEQWDEGARWLRCDVVALAFGEFSWGNVERVVGTADDLVARALADHRLCIDTPHEPTSDGPWVNMDGVELVACDGRSQWEFAMTVDFDDDVYPGWDELVERTNEACEPALTDNANRSTMIATVPPLTNWSFGHRHGICWLL